MPTITATAFWPAVKAAKERCSGCSRPSDLVASSDGIRMISLKASRALLRTATVSWVVTEASVAAIV